MNKKVYPEIQVPTIDTSWLCIYIIIHVFMNMNLYDMDDIIVYMYRYTYI